MLEITSRNKTLKKLCFSHTELQGSELLKNHSNLSSLSFKNAENLHTSALDVFSYSTTLTEVDLTGIKLSNFQFSNLIKTLQEKGVVESLNLSRMYMNPAQLEMLVSFLHQNNSLKKLTLSHFSKITIKCTKRWCRLWRPFSSTLHSKFWI